MLFVLTKFNFVRTIFFRLGKCEPMGKRRDRQHVNRFSRPVIGFTQNVKINIAPRILYVFMQQICCMCLRGTLTPGTNKYVIVINNKHENAVTAIGDNRLILFSNRRFIRSGTDGKSITDNNNPLSICQLTGADVYEAL